MKEVNPNFLVIGANKAGTTSLHNGLSKHPDVFMSPIKEPMYFRYGYSNEPLIRGEERFQKGTIYKREAYEELFKGVRKEKAIGESSTTYLANPECAKRIYDYNPGMKIIVILRNPIDRAFSNYRMYVDWGLENKPFSRVVSDELSGKKVNQPQGRKYLELGKYYESIREYLNVFGEDQVKVFLYEDFKEPRKLYKQVFNFLEVEPAFDPSMDQRLNISNKKSYNPYVRLLQTKVIYKLKLNKYFNLSILMPHLDASTKGVLQQYYEQEILKLQPLIGRDISHWL